MSVTLVSPPTSVAVVDPDTGLISNTWSLWFANLYNRIGPTDTTYAPTDATYITQTTSTVLTRNQPLSVLTSGFVKVENGTGVLSSTGNTQIQAADLASTGVTSGTYGSATQAPVLSIDPQGRVVTASAVTISGVDPSGAAGGDLSGTYPSPTVAKINGVSLAGLATGILKNTTGTGVPSIAVAADFPTLNQNTSGNAATVTTNANLTGPITSVGNATSIASQTGTGTKFVMDTSPTLVTPLIGTPTSGTLTNCTGLPITAGTLGTLGATRGGTGMTSYTGGDIPYCLSANTLSALAIGSNGKVLTSNGFIPTWQTPSAQSLFGGWSTLLASTSQTIAAGSAANYLISSTPTSNIVLTLDVRANFAIGAGLWFNNQTAGTSTVTVTAGAGDTIGGQASVIIGPSQTLAIAYAGNSDWKIISHNDALGTSGYVLTSNGLGTLPTFQSAAAPSGTLFNTQSSTFTSTTTVSNTTYVDTGLTVTITPTSSSNKVLVTANMCVGNNTTTFPYFKLFRGGTQIFLGDAVGSRQQISTGTAGTVAGGTLTVSLVYLDSPATTSATTYKVQFASSGAANSYINRSDTDTNSGVFARGASSITTCEVKA